MISGAGVLRVLDGKRQQFYQAQSTVDRQSRYYSNIICGTTKSFYYKKCLFSLLVKAIHYNDLTYYDKKLMSQVCTTALLILGVVTCYFEKSK